MQIETVRDGIATDYRDISFLAVGNTPLAELADMYWGELERSVVVTYQGKTYMCDGVDPVGGDWFSEEILAELRKVFDSVEVK